jgi:geranylgeranyl diphosphate synthase type I
LTSAADIRLDRLAAQVGEWLRPYVEAPNERVAPFYGMMGYHLGWASPDGDPLTRPAASGKRLRPTLAILTCVALGGEVAAARGPAVAVELVHNFSLVHDDVQDQSEHRHGRETVWHRWGVPQAINVGDALFALAQVALVEHLDPHARLADALRHLNETCLRLVEGQFLDLHLESVGQISLELYEQMIARKTAALIECACRLGALVAAADRATEAACARFGRELGLAFQLQDDLLGVWGDPAVTGKPSGADIRSRKKSLPMVLALQLTTGAVRRELERQLAGSEPLEADDVARILAIMVEVGVKGRAEAMVEARFVAVERAIRAALPAGREADLLALCSRLRARVA